MYRHTFAVSIKKMKLEDAIKQKSFPSQEERLAVNLFYTANWLGGHNSGLLKQHDLTPQQYNILRILRGQKGNPISVYELPERMLDKQSNASRLVDKLVAKSLCIKRECPTDKRKAEVLITEAGLALLAQLDEPMKQRFVSQVSALSSAEVETLNHLLDKLRSTQ
jgi:DNA-binding MarR family transcriptional regulator